MQLRYVGEATGKIREKKKNVVEGVRKRITTTKGVSMSRH